MGTSPADETGMCAWFGVVPLARQRQLWEWGYTSGRNFLGFRSSCPSNIRIIFPNHFLNFNFTVGRNVLKPYLHSGIGYQIVHFLFWSRSHSELSKHSKSTSNSPGRI